MTMKQQMATGFLAMLIVGSVALMPAKAGGDPRRGAMRQQPAMAGHAAVNASELPQDQVRDLTYN